MGIIRAALNAVGGALADQWLEFIEAEDMGEGVLFTAGVPVRRGDKRNQNKKGTSGVISTGSTIMVGENQFMLLVDGGKVVDYSGEAGYFTVDNAGAPSLLGGQVDEAILDTFERLKHGGTPSMQQKAYYVSTQEIKNIAFGTVNPINYFDNFYNAELYLRCHGYFSVRVVDPLKFYAEAVPKIANRMDISSLQKLYLAEFLTALQTAIGRMSVDGIRISHVGSKSQELANYMSTVLDEEWTKRRGMVVESVGIASISYDEESKKLINIRNQGAMLSDPSIREGYVQGGITRGIEAAGSNSGGAVGGMMGVGLGMQAGGGFAASASAANQAQMARQEAQPSASDKASWQCDCGEKSTGNFCPSCGAKRPGFCPECGGGLSGGAKFCPHCGHQL